MPGPDRFALPRLSSRGGWIWAAGTLALVVGALTVLVASRPENRWATAVVAALLVVGTVWACSRRIWIEPAAGVVVRESFWCLRRRAELATASVALVSNRVGVLLLAVRGPRPVFVPVLALTDHVRGSQSPQVLRLLADQLDSRAPGSRGIAAQLQAQADFVAVGGAAEQSPLAPLITRGVGRAAQAGGAGSLFD